MAEEQEKDVVLFQTIGLDDTLAQATAKNKKKCAALKEVLVESGLSKGGHSVNHYECDRFKAILLQSLSVKCPETALVHRAIIAK